MNWRSRWTFWAAVTAVLALVSVPSIEWAASLSAYARFLAAWEPAPLKPSGTSFTPHEPRGGDLALKPAEFRLKAPKARSVELVGDFNAWKPGLLALRREDGGWWSISVPVPAGRRRYLYLVDGEPRVDPRADTADGPEGRRVSVRTVK